MKRRKFFLFQKKCGPKRFSGNRQRCSFLGSTKKEEERKMDISPFQAFSPISLSVFFGGKTTGADAEWSRPQPQPLFSSDIYSIRGGKLFLREQWIAPPVGLGKKVIFSFSAVAQSSIYSKKSLLLFSIFPRFAPLTTPPFSTVVHLEHHARRFCFVFRNYCCFFPPKESCG